MSMDRVEVCERRCKGAPGQHGGCTRGGESCSGHDVEQALMEAYEREGARVNAISVEVLFEHYLAAGFLYPAKLERLRPHLPRVLENWRRSMSAPIGSLLHHVITVGDVNSGRFCSGSLWRSARGRVQAQHLVSTDRPESTRIALIASQRVMIAAPCVRTSENWFRAENRFPARVFGSVPASLGASVASVSSHVVMAWPRSVSVPSAVCIDVHRVSRQGVDAMAIESLVARCDGPVVAETEELTGPDPELDGLDAIHRSVGLRRWRRLLGVFDRHDGRAIGAAVVNRGPLGLNFSFLENRCDLWCDPELDPARRRDVLLALLGAARSWYGDFELAEIPLSCDSGDAALLERDGARRLHAYRRCVWRRAGFDGWCGHVDAFYDRLRGLGRKRSARIAASAPNLEAAA